MQQHPREVAGNWLAQARRDLDSAHYLFDGARYDAACFASQQAAEKALKAALIWLAGDRPRTQQLGVLIVELASHRADAVEALGDVAALDPYYVTTRYPDASAGASPAPRSSRRKARSHSSEPHARSPTSRESYRRRR